MALLARVTSPADMQRDFMEIGRSGENLSRDEFLALAKRLVNEEVNEELMPAFDKLRKLLETADDFAALNPGAAIPDSLAEELLAAYVEVADGIVDSVYVLFQMAHTLYIPFDACFIEVHRSNMSKFVQDPTDGKLVAVKDAGGKIMKGPNFSKPDLRPIIAQAIFKAAPTGPAVPEMPAAEHQDHTQLH